ncbi:hypothetical protein INH39_25150 [Massilia violaceinigra]|uniref:Uncharacterized protein n=1 Tax=Massilia violaceinigra TaxID=2045208 RepID=A0ABY4A1R8_9BURK|nr:hypothetical protein [Massilia violaceinigra]UOD28699.1 hypothetical protein INH39_25150 [Massilia violaceinigra]
MMKTEKLVDPAVSNALPVPQLGLTDPTPQFTAKDKYFVAMCAGEFPSIADAISEARLPPGTKAMGEWPALPGSSKILAFKAPPRTIDDANEIAILIIEPLANGNVILWLGGTDLAREQREDAEDDVDNFLEITGGEYKIFERV